MVKQEPHILQIDNVLFTSDIFTERFCCDLEQCKGVCCVEGDSGAPLELDEIGGIEDCLDAVWNNLSASSQAIIDKQGVAYSDTDGDLVTSIVGGKDCVFTCYEKGICLCTLEKAFRAGKTRFLKPISCSLYPLREKTFSDGLVGLRIHHWSICQSAIKKGRQMDLPLYRFLQVPLTLRFGKDWYQKLCDIADQLKNQKLI